MRFIPALALAATVLLSGVSSVGAQEKLVNEIGNVTIEGNSKVDMFRPEKDQQTITRNFQKQPPLIPHSVKGYVCLLYTSPSPRDRTRSRMPSSA